MTLNTIAQHVKYAATTTRGKIAGGAALLMGSAAAHAQEASSAEAAFTELQTQASNMASNAWPVVVAVVGSLLAIGLFKKFANKAT